MRNITCRGFAVWISIVAAALFTTAVPALGQAATGRIVGTLQDPSGALVPGAQVVIRSLASGAARSATTDREGRYVFEAVPVGRYQVSANAVGFAASVRNDVAVTAGGEATVDFELLIARYADSVSVTAEAMTVGPETSVPATARTSDTASLLAGLPGVSLYGAGGVSSLPAIHGMEDDRVRILVDGMDLVSACANHMNPPLSYIDPSNVGAIRVYAGIAPVSVGGDSIGGTIAVYSPEPEFATGGRRLLLKGQAGTFYRSNGNVSGVNLGFVTATASATLTYNGSVSQSENYTAAKDFKSGGPAAVGRGWLAGNAVGSSRYESQNHALGVSWRHAGHLIDLKAGVQNIPYQGFPTQRMDMTSNDNVRAALRYVGQHQWGFVETRIFGDYTRHKMDFGPDKQFYYGSAATILAPGMPMDTEGLNLGALLKADARLSDRYRLAVGVETQRYRLDDWWPPSPAVLPPGYTVGGMAPDTFININDGRRDRIGVFAEWEARWNPRWTTSLGIRSDTVLMNTGAVHGYNNTAMYNGPPLYPATTFNASDRRRTDANFDLTALSRHAPAATLAFEVGFARKTHSPNLYQRYAWSTNTMAMEMINFAGDGNFYIGNLALEPEVAHTLSASVDWHDATKGRRGVVITPYITYVRDYINVRRCPTTACGTSAAVIASTTATTGFVYLQFVNQSSKVYGIDVSGRSVLATTRDYGRFTASGTLNVVRGVDRTTGDHLYNIMPVNARLAVAHNLGGWTNTIEGQLVGAKTDVSQVRNELETAGYGLLNLRSSYDWKMVRLDIGLENVLNTFYSAPLGGAYVGQGATMSGSAIPWGILVPGMGRSLYLGASLRF